MARRRPADDDELLSSDELNELELEVESSLPVEPIQDELLESPADVPLLDRLEEPAPAANHALVHALWFLGVIVTLLLVVQTVQLLRVHEAPIVLRPPPAAPARVETAPPAPAPSPIAEIDRTLREMRVRLSKGLYEDVVTLLEPIAEDPARLDPNQRFEAQLLLARAHRALGNVEKAQRYQLLATDQMIERREPAQVLEYASDLSRESRQPEARAELMKLLARRDGLTARDAPWLSLAEARIADAWYGQAKQSGHLAPLPGARETAPAAVPAAREGGR